MRAAFTLVELMIGIGIIAIIFTFSSINLLSLQHKTTLNQQVELVASDLRSQQLASMTGSSEGIHFDTNSYTLIGTSSYVIDLPPTLTFTNINLPDSEIVFQNGSGEIKDFNNTKNTFSLTDSGGESKTFTLNALGVIYQIQ